jgi:hypothetical protein
MNIDYRYFLGSLLRCKPVVLPKFCVYDAIYPFEEQVLTFFTHQKNDLQPRLPFQV